MITATVFRARSASASSSAITNNVMAQARSTPPAVSCSRPNWDQSSRKSRRIFSGSTEAVVMELTLAPAVTVAGQHGIGRGRSPGSRLVVRKIEGSGAPVVQNRLNGAPARLHHVLPCIQGHIALHGIHQQGFVSAWRSLAEAGAVVEIHRDR